MKQVPNILSLSRTIIAPFLIISLDGGQRTLFTVLLLIGAVTDFLDGYIARKFKAQSRTGLVLDAVTDKILVTAAAIAIIANNYISIWQFLLLISRDIAVLIGAALVIILARGVRVADIQHSWPSKACTFFQFVTLGAYLYNFVPNYLLAATVLLGLMAIVGYFKEASGALASKR